MTHLDNEGLDSGTVAAECRAGDADFMVTESEHVDKLRECDVRLIGLLLNDSSAGLSDWKSLAGLLGIANDDVRRIEATSRIGGRLVVPGEEVLKLWRRKKHSTIRVLRQVLQDMNREDVVRQLDIARLQIVNFSLVLRRNGRGDDEDVLNVRCPGRKPLVDHVRPLLSRRVHFPYYESGQRVCVQLHIANSTQHDIIWTSPAEHFAGQQWTLTIEHIRPPVSGSSTLPRNVLRGTEIDHSLNVNIQRNAISGSGDEAIIFGYTTATPTSAVTLTSSLNLESLNIASSSNPELDDDRPPFENVIDDRPEVIEARRLPGFHDVNPLCKEQEVESLLGRYLSEPGRYIIRPSASHPEIALALSVTHNRQIRHYYIFSVHRAPPSSTVYTIRVGEKNRWNSLVGLLDYYHQHPIETYEDGSGDLVLSAPVL